MRGVSTLGLPLNISDNYKGIMCDGYCQLQGYVAAAADATADDDDVLLKHFQ